MSILGKKMKRIALVPLALMLAIGLTACGGGSGAVAATFNGGQVMEDEVTNYIAQIRTAYGLEDNTAWADYLNSIGMSAAQVRSDIINMLAEEKLVESAASQAGVTVEQSEIDDAINSMKSQYASEDEFKKELEAQGMTEEELRNSYKQYALGQLVREQLVQAPEATPEQLQEYIAREAPNYSGAKRSSHILFDLEDRSTAESILQQARSASPETFASLAAANSKDGSAQNGGDVGWDKLTTFVTEYQTALDGLSVGQVTQELVESQFGYHIIMCTEAFNYTEGMTEADIPEAILERIRSTMNSELESQAYTDYMSQLVAGANLVIKDMPSGLPYDVATTASQQPATTDATGAGATGADAAAPEDLIVPSQDAASADIPVSADTSAAPQQ